MCGIFGITNFKAGSLNDARNALHTLTHRGPDQWDEYFDNYIYLGHRRLSIIDLSESGRQPMMSHDGNVVIIVNGEIYNYTDLKREIGSNVTYKSASDSEILIHGYRKWGIDKLLEKLEGMYAFAIFDKLKGQLYIARDRVGVKPLYYSIIDGQLVFASELKAINKYYNHKMLPIDYTALYDFLTYRYIPAPKTMYKNIYKLEPANYLHLKLSNNSLINKTYWKLDVNNNRDTLEQATKKINLLVDQSVDEQMMSDVPLGFFLSGGLDSSTVVSSAAKKRKSINTYSIGFLEETHDESYFADLVAEYYQTNHKKKVLSEFITSELVGNLKTWFDEPFADFSCFPTYLVSKFAKEHSTVVLTGDGGDEVFGGYNWYNEFYKKSKFRFPFLSPIGRLFPDYYNKQHLFAKVIRKIEYPHLLDDLELYTKLQSGKIRKQKADYRDLWKIPYDYDDYWYFRKFYRPDLDLFTRLQYMDFHTYLPDDILTKVDRVSMSVSLECRVPLLSTSLIEYVYSLPESVRYHNGELKGLMKKALINNLPPEIINREKKGFSIPTAKWAPNLFGHSIDSNEYILGNLFSIDT